MTDSKLGRTHRVVLIYRPENFESAVETFRAVLGLGELEGPIDPPGDGVRAMVSFEQGIEFITPHGEGAHRAFLEEFLDKKGEGLFTLAWTVDSLEAAEQRAAAAGYPRQGDRINLHDANPDWREKYACLIEAPLPAVGGVNIMLIQSQVAMK